MATPAQSFLEQGTLFHGRYEVTRLLGSGGMGAVYEVLDRTTRRRRALKVLLPQVVAREDVRQRFQREATVAAEIESEHVAETLDAGVDADSGAPFIVLELLKGQELADMVKERGPLPPEEVDLYLSQTAVALEKAHAAGVVHRDLKPENLFVTYRDDGSPRIKVLDFGIAKVISETVTGPETQGVIGSPLYMAPEQMHCEIPISPQTDVYALGLIAYTLLVGEPYWSEERERVDGIYPLLVKMMKGVQEPPSARAARRRSVELPPRFDAFFAQATAPSPNERFDGPLDLVMELAEVLSLEAPSLAAMPSDAFPTRRDTSPGPTPSQEPALAPANARPAARSAGAGTLVSGGGISGGGSGATTNVPVTAPPDVSSTRSPWPMVAAVAALLGAGGFALRSMTTDETGSATAAGAETAEEVPSEPEEDAPATSETSALPTASASAEATPTATASATASVSAAPPTPVRASPPAPGPLPMPEPPATPGGPTLPSTR